jgi:hypothetical protein
VIRYDTGDDLSRSEHRLTRREQVRLQPTGQMTAVIEPGTKVSDEPQVPPVNEIAEL